MEPLKGKSITTSVPSIAIRFHTGDEEVDIYPSADDEGDDEKEEDASPPTVSPSVSPSIPSRDASPMKEYLRGLGKRSTSVDGGMAEAGSSSSDTWRIFHELKGKITKTVEEKLTEMKNDRKASGTPVLSGLNARRRRLRAGGNDNSSISDSEDISEASNKGENKGAALPVESPAVTEPPERNVKFSSGSTFDMPSTSADRERSTKKPKLKKGRKKPKTFDTAFDVDGNTSTTESGTSDGVVESGVEILEDTTFINDEDFGDVPTVDYRTDPPTSLNSAILSERRRMSPSGTASLQYFDYRDYVREFWHFRYLVVVIAVFFAYLYFPLSRYFSGIIMGIFLTLIYHLTVGLSGWYESVDMPEQVPYHTPSFKNKAILEAEPLQDMLLLATKCAGWMNELPVNEYDPDTYHINDTQTIYVRLEGSTLRLSHPKSKVQKRASWNERKYKMKFVHQRIYDISGCAIKLLPDGLTRKRLWSKKYPICIILTKESSATKSVINLPFDTVSLEENDGSTPASASVSRDISANSLFENSVEDPSLDPASNYKLQSETSIFSDLSVIPPVFETVVGSQTAVSAEPVTPSDDDTFCLVDSSIVQGNCLYLFARADRQKEDWYRRLAAAVRLVPPSPEEQEARLESAVVSASKPELQVFIPVSSFDTASLPGADFVKGSARETATDNYIEFMNRFHLQVQRTPSTRLPKQAEALDLDREVECDVMWVNAIAGHVLYDILRNDEWKERIRVRIQKKLEMIKLPYFMETLVLSDIDMGTDVPMIHRASRPVLDARGLWIDLDVSFEGHVCMTLETKLNLMKLKTTTTTTTRATPEQKVEDLGASASNASSEKCKSPIYDSEIEDTAETSDSDEDEPSKTSSESGGKSVESSPSKKPLPGGKGVIRMMNKIVASKYFQQATENKYIKRAMEGVSNTTITLTVEIRGVSGELVLNMPPPPSDRMWYGFRGNPKLWIKASPKFGDRHLNIKHVVSWIEKKLIQEFQKKFVLPNMDDLVIAPMSTQLPE